LFAAGEGALTSATVLHQPMHFSGAWVAKQHSFPRPDSATGCDFGVFFAFVFAPNFIHSMPVFHYWLFYSNLIAWVVNFRACQKNTDVLLHKKHVYQKVY